MAINFLDLDTEIQRMKDAPHNAAKGKHAILAYGELKRLNAEPNLTSDEKADLRERTETILRDGFGINPDADPPLAYDATSNLNRTLVKAIDRAFSEGMTAEQIAHVYDDVRYVHIEGEL